MAAVDWNVALFHFRTANRLISKLLCCFDVCEELVVCNSSGINGFHLFN